MHASTNKRSTGFAFSGNMVLWSVGGVAQQGSDQRLNKICGATWGPVNGEIFWFGGLVKDRARFG